MATMHYSKEVCRKSTNAKPVIHKYLGQDHVRTDNIETHNENLYSPQIKNKNKQK